MSNTKTTAQEQSTVDTQQNTLIAMMDPLPNPENKTIQAQSPLYHVDLDLLAKKTQKEGGVHLRERAFLGYLNLRCNQALNEHRDAIEKVLGIPLPREPLSSSELENYSIRWVSPDEWLIVVPGIEAFAIESKLRRELTGHYSIINSSGGSTMLELSGHNVVELLKKSTPVDLHLSQFPIGKVVSTLFAKSSAVIRRTGETQFELIIRRSFADYIWLWIQDASAEFGLVIDK
ncbi:sarcosine oxidase subunit gamma [Marinomonas arenicola]|uniref:Sarcosine oxidase subunit gamma family protein n=1 Tax=Marinomonas arenicola TaxID=569601 RepID=A0ABU9G891_9GAMM